VVQNMPSAGGLRGANYLYNVAARDGTVVGVVSQTVAVGQVLATTPGSQYDAPKYTWIGRINSNVEVHHTWHASGVRSIEDAKKREVRVSTTGLTGNSAKTPLMLNILLGTKFKVISGYSTTEMRLAVERGEVEGICGLSYDTYAAANPEWLKDKKIRFILQTGSKPAKALPEVPLLINYVQDPKERAALQVLGVDEEVGRPHMFPPGVPKYLEKALRTAFNETMQDPKFLSDARRMRIEPEPMTGEQMETAIKEAYAAPADIVAVAAKLWPPTVPDKKAEK